jgi:hypothetical protein
MRLGAPHSRTPLAVIATVVALAVMAALTGFSAAGTAATGSLGSASRVIAKNDHGKMTSRIVGTASDGSKVTGSFTPLRFVKRDGKQKVKGVIDGIVTHADGTKEKFSGLRTVKVKKINGRSLAGISPRSAAQVGATCDILRLVLGPLDLDLLGLRVHLDRIVLNIVAATGAGNLLGNLLCAITGLLDDGPLAGLLGELNNLLNRILRVLNLGV